jgi:putative Mn2+ efflux pump MntP
MPKVIDPLVYDFMMNTSRKLFNAAQSGDVELAEATLTTIATTIDSYVVALKEGDWHETNKG